jgi:hypothetical protein
VDLLQIALRFFQETFRCGRQEPGCRLRRAPAGHKVCLRAVLFIHVLLAIVPGGLQGLIGFVTLFGRKFAATLATQPANAPLVIAIKVIESLAVFILS